MPLPDGRGEQPTSTLVLGSRVKRRSVGPSAQSKSAELLPIGLAGLKPRELFSSEEVGTPVTTAPVPSSYSVTEKVLEKPPPAPVQTSCSNSGTLIHRTLKALTLAKPSACTGKSRRSKSQADGFKSAQAGAIRGGPVRKAGTLTTSLGSPAPNVMLPLELRKNRFHVQLAVPTGPPKVNSTPPLRSVLAPADELGTGGS